MAVAKKSLLVASDTHRFTPLRGLIDFLPAEKFTTSRWKNLVKYSARKLPLELTQCNVGLAAGEQDAKASIGQLGVTRQGAEHE